MTKSSRPDIQVLEERIARLKSQLLEYKGLRLYGSTKKRLSAVSDELSECLSIICEVVNADSNNISSSSLSAFDECTGEVPSEFSSDGDLSDTFLLSPSSYLTKSDSSPYSAKDIVRTYSSKFKLCAETLGCETGIIQVNQFCQLINSWYQARFSNEQRNPNFFFKANRIHEWIDLLILAAGHALHDGLFPVFISDMNIWIRDLNTSKDQSWVLPYSVMKMKNIDSSTCTQEAVLLEKILKSILYDEDFYPTEKTSVKEIVISNSEFTEEDLTIDTIISSCPKLVVTSSFDSKKYEEEER